MLTAVKYVADDKFFFSRTAPTGRLVDISGDDDDDEEDVAVKQFGGLKVGFTPDMHASHRPRRVCHSSVYINILLVYLVTCLQCFDAVGWAGRASGL